MRIYIAQNFTFLEEVMLQEFFVKFVGTIYVYWQPVLAWNSKYKLHYVTIPHLHFEKKIPSKKI